MHSCDDDVHDADDADDVDASVQYECDAEISVCSNLYACGSKPIFLSFWKILRFGATATEKSC